MGLIFLTGMPGAGKSTVGILLAAELGWNLFDLDQAVEQTAGKPIHRIFAEEGESVFRDLEADALRNACRMSNTVVSLGAGALERDENAVIVKERGTLVYLRADIDLLVARNRKSGHRPLLADTDGTKSLRERLSALLDRRAATYSAAPIVIDQSSDDTPEILAKRILRAASCNA